MRTVLIFLTISLTLSCAPKKLNEEQFTKEYFKKAVELNPEVEYKIVDNLHLSSVYKGNDYQHFLDNAYSEYKLDPSNLDSVIIMYIKSASDLYHPDDSIDIDRIVPVIKDKNYIVEIKQSLSERNGEEYTPNLVTQEYNDELTIIFAEDGETSMAYFTNEDFEKTGFPFDSLLDKSIQNLNQILPEIQSFGDNGFFGIFAGGDYEASLILFKSIWTRENFDVKGDIVIAIPTRDVLLVTGSKDQEGLENIRKKVEETYESGSYYLTKELFIWNGNKFEVLKE